MSELYTKQELKEKIDMACSLTAKQCADLCKQEIRKLEEREKKLIECIRFYAEGEIGCDLEIRPEKRELWSIPDKWSQRSMSDHYAGKCARQTLKEIGINNE